MINRIGNLLKKTLQPVIKVLARRHVTPNAVTFTGFLFSLIGAFFFSRGWFAAGGIMLLLSGFSDMIDGELSRRQNRVTRFGAFLDSTLDRAGESAVLTGIALYLGALDVRYAVLAIVALSGSLLVSYTRARAEGLDLPGRVGIFERGVRFFFLLTGSFAGPRVMVVVLLILVLGTLSTVIHRMIFVYRNCRTTEPDRTSGQ